MQSVLAMSVCLLCSPLFAQNQTELPQQTVMVYKQIGNVKLNAYIYFPHDHQSSDKRAAIVFFCGGGWKSGTPTQFTEHCKYLAKRGMVAITADYRVSQRQGTKADSCVADAKSAVRWIRNSADELGIDSDRIVAGGGSAGGHIAACTGVVSGWEESGANLKVSSVPNAMALFNPALILADVKGKYDIDEEDKNLRERMNTDPVNLSPYHQIKGKIPPTIIFHGKADMTVPYESAALFAEKAGKKSRVELHGYEEQEHGFFNVKRSAGEYYRKTMKTLDAFLVSLKYLEPQ